ncbi:MAG TPA: hypothetical protein VLS89_05485 [Candidatus Nanopelagicales bacterium]|nr:hypothetical protein [Candidatus Nanopelagicales bacterium]
MHPLVRGAAAAATLFALSSLDPPRAPAPPVIVPPAAARAPGSLLAAPAAPAGGPVTRLAALCPPRTLPEGQACIPLPAHAGADEQAATSPAARAGALRAGGEHLPRRPDRPAAPDAYLYPVGPPEGSPALIGGFELSPQGERRPGVVDLAAMRGEKVALLPLDHQEGDAEVAFVGELRGITVGTLHRVREGDREHRFLVLYGHLERPGPGVVPGARLRAADAVGFAGDSGGADQVELRFEVRKLREGARIERLEPQRLLDQAISIPCDPRNVLPLRGGP